MEKVWLCNLILDPFTLIEGCDTTVDSQDFERDFLLHLDAFPNPSDQYINLKFVSKNEHIRICLYDIIGSELKVILNGKVNQGEHLLKLDTDSLAPGKYFLRISSDKSQKTKSFVKY